MPATSSIRRVQLGRKEREGPHIVHKGGGYHFPKSWASTAPLRLLKCTFKAVWLLNQPPSNQPGKLENPPLFNQPSLLLPWLLQSISITLPYLRRGVGVIPIKLVSNISASNRVRAPCTVFAYNRISSLQRHNMPLPCRHIPGKTTKWAPEKRSKYFLYESWLRRGTRVRINVELLR